MKQFLSLSLIAIVVAFTSCEKMTYVDYYIDNKSSKSLMVNGEDIIHSQPINDTYKPNDKKVVVTWQKRAKETTLYKPTTIFGNNLVIITTEGDTLRKDYRELSNWTSNVDNQRAVASHTYVLTVQDSDF